MIDLVAHLTRQAAFSRATFGPGPRTEGVLDHITKEVEEVRACYRQTTANVPIGTYFVTGDPEPHFRYREVPKDPDTCHADAAPEWVDLAILSLDGLLRCIAAQFPHMTFDQVAQKAAAMIVAKQGKNERRNWPDWRGQSADKAIEHQRGHED